MSLENIINVKSHYTRSINIERDAKSAAVLESYIPTSRAIRTVERIADTFGNQAAPRAWSLVGPYGSGKSVFAVFTSHLLGDPDSEANKYATKLLKMAGENSLASKVRRHLLGSQGYMRVLITGSPEPLKIRILKAFSEAATEFWSAKRGRNSYIVEALSEASRNPKVTTKEVIELVAGLQHELANTKSDTVCGILLVIDELGKFLEYEARHHGASDIFLLQELAELACKGHAINLNVLVLLHQSFDQYAKGLSEQLRNEWTKVQGRYENVPFLESAEQVLRVVSSAFQNRLSDRAKKQISADVRHAVDILLGEEALPSSMSAAEAKRLFENCYPLHPLTAVILVYLCQKIAQNERTLFSYLGSHEEHGLNHAMKYLEPGDWITPAMIYDYFISNQSSSMTDYMTHRRWAEVVTALERLQDPTQNELELLKAIGLLNIIGSKAGLKASTALMSLVVPEKAQLKKAIDNLTAKSIVVYRKFNSEYKVWQGSDFDIENAIADQLANIKSIDIGKSIASMELLIPVVARKYTIETGALRYFVPVFVDRDTFETVDVTASEPRIIYFVSKSNDDSKLFSEVVLKRFTGNDLVVLCKSGAQLADSFAEIEALERIEKTAQELNTDPVAKREFYDRFNTAKNSTADYVRSIFDSPQENDWYWQGKPKKIESKRGLQATLSEVLSEVYSKAPIIHNELINRDKPSTQANAARNQLMLCMLKNEALADLGIEKFPPEKAIYRALLKETGLHRQKRAGEWHFVAPAKETSLHAIWQEIESFFDSTEQQAKPIVELNDRLLKAPFGVKAGVLPILYFAFYLANKNEIAVYESKNYSPYFNEEVLERFIKSPHTFTFQLFRIKGLRASIFEQYSKVLFNDDTERTLLELAKPLAEFIGRLPEYTKRTKSSELSIKAQRVRDTFNAALSPEILLLEDLPRSLGYEPEKLQDDTERKLQQFANDLTEALRELRHFHSKFLVQMQAMVAECFHVDKAVDLAELRRKLIVRYAGIEQLVVGSDGLSAFISRLVRKEGDDDGWFENILMGLAKRASKSWTDTDRLEAEVKLKDFSRQIFDLEKLRTQFDKAASGKADDLDVYLLKSLKKGSRALDQVVAVDRNRHELVKPLKDELLGILADRIPEPDLQLAAIAELVDQFLTEYAAATAAPKSKAHSKKVSNA